MGPADTIPGEFFYFGDCGALMPYTPEYGQITKGLGKLTPEVMARISQATEITLSAVPVTDSKGAALGRDNPKWMKVVSSLWIKKIGTAEAVWIYTLIPCAFSVSAAAYTAPSAVSIVDGSAGSAINGFNLAEWGTDAVTISPGVLWSELPAGFEVRPISVGTVVLCIPVRVVIGAIPVVAGGDFISAWGFSMVNAIAGECA